MSGRPRIPDDEAAAMMRAAGAEPLEPYPGALAPWRSRCSACGCEINPRLSNIRQGSGACKHCAQVGRRPRTIAAKIATATLEAAGLVAVDSYPGNAHALWRMQCTSCGHELTSKLASVKRGIRGCPLCAEHFAAASLPALLFIMIEPESGMEHFGVTGLDLTQTLRALFHRGWQLYATRYYADANDAYRAEQQLATLKSEMVQAGGTGSAPEVWKAFEAATATPTDKHEPPATSTP
jgi:hypothetical protein